MIAKHKKSPDLENIYVYDLRFLNVQKAKAIKKTKNNEKNELNLPKKDDWWMYYDLINDQRKWLKHLLITILQITFFLKIWFFSRYFQFNFLFKENRMKKTKSIGTIQIVEWECIVFKRPFQTKQFKRIKSTDRYAFFKKEVNWKMVNWSLKIQIAFEENTFWMAFLDE